MGAGQFFYRVGWALMGIPTGYRKPWKPLLRYGPYRWGAELANFSLERIKW